VFAVNCPMFSIGLSAGHLAGSATMLILSGTSSLPVACHHRLSSQARDPGGDQPAATRQSPIQLGPHEDAVSSRVPHRPNCSVGAPNPAKSLLDKNDRSRDNMLVPHTRALFARVSLTCWIAGAVVGIGGRSKPHRHLDDSRNHEERSVPWSA